MAFCTNCGKELSADAKFCSDCGASIGTGNQAKRKSSYEGELHKCPNCGDILNSFVSVCPSCGYELRGCASTSAVVEFAEKLNRTTTEYQKVNVIRSFPIPNTKEDIFEFMILASSNIDERPNSEEFDAWIAKFEQCYQKAKLSFRRDSDFDKIQAIYEKTHNTIKKIRRKGPLRKLLTVVLPIVILIGLSIAGLKSCAKWLANPEPYGTDEEVARLEGIVLEVEKALESKEYDLAMMQAKSIDFFPNHEAISDHERQWDIKRDYLIKKVIAAAAEDGIVMEYPTDTADEKDQKDGGESDNYVNNNEEIQRNIDEINAQMDGIKEQWDSIWNDNDAVDNTAVSERFKDVPYSVTNVKDFTFCIPEYWSEEGSKNEYLQYYAEQGEKVVMLSIAYPEETDDDYEVTFDGLYADNDNMIKAVAAMFTDGDVVDYEIIESDYCVKGILYHFTYSQKINWLKSVDGSGYYFCFPSEDDRRWFYVVMMHTNNVASDDYRDDYMDLIATIKKKS